jgi:hypothetical protein
MVDMFGAFVVVCGQFFESVPPPPEPQFDRPIVTFSINTVNTDVSWGEPDSLVVHLQDCERFEIIDAKTYERVRYSDRAPPYLHFNPISCVLLAGTNVFTGDASGELKVPCCRVAAPAFLDSLFLFTTGVAAGA